MHNNYYFLRQLTPALEKAIRLSVVSECFSQNKDELVIRFERRIHLFLSRQVCRLLFHVCRSRKIFIVRRRNSIDLFEKLIGQRVEGIRQFENERSFTINFSNNFHCFSRCMETGPMLFSFMPALLSKYLKTTFRRMSH